MTSASTTTTLPDFRALFEAVPDPYLVLTPDFTIVAVNDAYLRATMTEREAILGHGLFEVFPANPGDPSATGVTNLKASLERVLEQRSADTMAVQKYDIRRPNAYGGEFEERYWSPINTPVFGPDGRIIYIVHCVEDVSHSVRVLDFQERNRQLVDLQIELEQRIRDRTAALEAMNQRLCTEMKERVRVDGALRDSEARYRMLFLSNPRPMWVYDRQTLEFLAVNRAAVQLYGYSEAEFMGMTIKDIRPREDVDALLKDMAKERPELNRPREWRHLRKDGRLITVEISSHTLQFAGHDAVLVLAGDVTDRKKLEAQLRQSQKMEAIGLLAGGVAHDFNNLLTAIMGYSRLIHHRLEPGDPVLQDADEIVKAAERAASLTRQLLAFSRQQVLEPQVLDLNAVVTDVDKMLRRLIGEHIDLLTAPAADLGRVKADPGQLEQVLMNLAVNARDAMPRGGKLTIETGNAELSEGYAQSRVDVTPGRYVLLAVSDTGCGMSPEVAARIFEPFFTTKELGHGTGLGLSTVHGIVKQSGGHIEVYSEPGHGTTFKVYLPRMEEAAEPVALRKPAGDCLRGTETILVVEDEAAIRRVIGISLRLQGYQVLEASDGSEAIALCDQPDQRIQLLITDVVMPLMSGPELAMRVAHSRPNLKVLFVSGYTDRALIHQGQRQPGTAFLQKPFTPETLARKVREILDEPGAHAA